MAYQLTDTDGTAPVSGSKRPLSLKCGSAPTSLRGLVSRHTLETANPGVDLENLSVGQTVCIPRDNVHCALPETYTLAATETLEAVAMRFNLPVASLLRANPCLAPQDFEGGVTVILPR